MSGRMVRVNERGLRIGESHPRSKLTDKEVEQLIADRGPRCAPLMSLSALARRYGMSKSGVKGILDGRARGQIGMHMDKAPTRKDKQPLVRVTLVMTLPERAKLHRNGGSAFVRSMLASV